jgi:hypothetical protein
MVLATGGWGIKAGKGQLTKKDRSPVVDINVSAGRFEAEMMDPG